MLPPSQQALKATPQAPTSPGQHAVIARQAIVDGSRAIFGYELFNRAIAGNAHTAASDAAFLFKATLNKPSKISAQTWMTQFFGLLCLSRGPFGQFAGR